MDINFWIYFSKYLGLVKMLTANVNISHATVYKLFELQNRNNWRDNAFLCSLRLVLILISQLPRWLRCIPSRSCITEADRLWRVQPGPASAPPGPARGRDGAAEAGRAEVYPHQQVRCLRRGQRPAAAADKGTGDLALRVKVCGWPWPRNWIIKVPTTPSLTNFFPSAPDLTHDWHTTQGRRGSLGSGAGMAAHLRLDICTLGWRDRSKIWLSWIRIGSRLANPGSRDAPDNPWLGNMPRVHLHVYACLVCIYMSIFTKWIFQALMICWLILCLLFGYDDWSLTVIFDQNKNSFYRKFTNL